MAEAQGKKDLKTICMKVLEIIKEKTKKSLNKSMKAHTNNVRKQRDSLKKSKKTKQTVEGNE